MGKKHKVELHEAFVWDCDECGRENLLRALPAEPPPDNEIRELLQLGPFEALPNPDDSNWVRVAETVICAYCQSEFQTLPPWIKPGDEGEIEEDTNI